MNFIPYTKQSLNESDLKAVVQSLKSPAITRGPFVEAFEKACADYCQAPFAVAFNSGTSALEAAAIAANITTDDTLIASPNTFVGSAAGALKLTKQLKFVDIDLKTGSPNFSSVSKNGKGRQIFMPVHYSGIAHSLKKQSPTDIIIEDACQAFGSKDEKGEPVGSCKYSDLCAFSFHPAKSLCTGEGGLVTTRSKKLFERLKQVRNNGITKNSLEEPWMYHVWEISGNYHMTDFSAALGLSQLRRVDQFLEKRKQIAKRYIEHLKSCKFITCLAKNYGNRSAHNLFPVLIDFEKLNLLKENVMKELKKAHIATQVHFIPLYKHPYFVRNFSFKDKDFPNMELFYKNELSLPLYPDLSLEQVDMICERLLATISHLVS